MPSIACCSDNMWDGINYSCPWRAAAFKYKHSYSMQKSIKNLQATMEDGGHITVNSDRLYTFETKGGKARR